MALTWKKTDLPTLVEKKTAAASQTCQEAIYAGIDVDLSGGKQHFSLTAHDQTNIDSMFTAVTLGATEFPYHADGNKCVMFSAADIVALYVAYKGFVTQQTTYCNFLRLWMNRETNPDALAAITYGDDLPADLATQMQEIMAQAQAQIEAIIAGLKQ